MRQPLREVVMLEVNVFQHFVIENAEEIYREVDQGFDVSKWWGQHHEKFPKLSHVVKNVLCIPATSANCERAFSTLTDVVTKNAIVCMIKQHFALDISLKLNITDQKNTKLGSFRVVLKIFLKKGSLPQMG